MKVALVHDHLKQNGGAERVLEALQALYPKAPTYTLVYDEKAIGDIFKHKDIRTSFLQNIPFSKRFLRWMLPLMPTATESYDLSEYDVVISSSSGLAKGIIPPAYGIHICYCHTPTRYLWTDAHSYIEDMKAPGFVKKLIPFVQTWLRVWDRQSADRVDFYIANSKTVQYRIKKYYDRSSTVINPPVDIQKFYISDKEKEYYLAGGRLVPYKRFDLLIDAFNQTKLPLKIFGTGPMMEELKSRALPNIEFLGRVSDEGRAELYANSIAFVHPQEEDFGITPIEAMASGRPVIAYRRGGAVETVIDGKTGELFDNQHWTDLADILIRFDHSSFNPENIRLHAEKFRTEAFREQIKTLVENAYNDHKKNTLLRM